MTDQPPRGPPGSAGDPGRKHRLAAALRENLKRRKAQARAQADLQEQQDAPPDEVIPRQPGENSP